MNKRIMTAIVVMLSTLPMLRAITLSECQELAQNNYPLIKKYQLIENSTQYDVSNARKNYLPQVSAFGQATWQNKVSGFPEQMSGLYKQIGLDLQGVNKDQYKIGVEASQIIWDGGNTKIQEALINRNGELEKASNDVDMYDLRKRINDIYFGILTLDAKLRQNDELQRVLKSNQALVEALVKNGVAMESDADAVMVELLTVQQQRVTITETAKTYKQMLSIFAGKDLSGESFEKPIMTDVDGRVLSRPELKVFEAKRNQLSTQKLSIKSSLMPQIGAFAQGYYGNPGFNMFDAMFDNHWTVNFLVGVKVQWNIGGLYRKKNNEAKIDAARHNVEVAQESFLFSTSIQTAQEQGRMASKQKELKSDNEIIALRESVRRASEAKLANGVIVVNDLLREIAAENQSKIAKDTHEIELLQDVYNLKYITNN